MSRQPANTRSPDGCLRAGFRAAEGTGAESKRRRAGEGTMQMTDRDDRQRLLLLGVAAVLALMTAVIALQVAVSLSAPGTPAAPSSARDVVLP